MCSPMARMTIRGTRKDKTMENMAHLLLALGYLLMLLSHMKF